MGIAGENLTFLYADIEKSTEKWDADSLLMADRVKELFDLLARLSTSYSGTIFKSLGDGLGLHFGSPESAIRFAIAAQLELVDFPLKIRIGIHRGVVVRDNLDFQGPALNIVSRLTDLGHGGQILISSESAKEISGEDFSIKPLGRYRVKGIRQRISVCQVCPLGEFKAFPPLRNSFTESSLPSPERQVFGREKERREILKKLISSHQRLITILGFGGMGKTTLAQILAKDAEPHFDGIWWVNCEGLSQFGHLAAAISAALGVENSLDAIREHFGDKEVLLVLDCFEELASNGTAPDQLLQGCPQLKILLTSRVLVGSPYEYEFETRGLAETRGGVKDAAALFVDTSQRAKSEFRPTVREMRKIRSLVRLLDSIPLAIILVASRLRHLTLDELFARVEGSVLASAKNVSNEAGRHANLRKVIQMSFSLLSKQEQDLLQEISVFRGGFGLPDALEVLDSDDVEDGVFRLRDHSLVFADVQEKTTRFRMLDSVNEFAREEVHPEKWERVLLRHSDYYLSKAKAAHDLFQARDFRALSKLTSLEGGNLRQGFRSAIAYDRTDTLLEYGKWLCEPYAETALIDDFRLLGNAVLEAARERNFVEEQLRILGLLAITAKRSDDPEQAIELFQEKARLAAKVDLVEEQADALGDLLGVVLQMKRPDLIRQFLSEYNALNPQLSGDIAIGHRLLRARCEAFVGNTQSAVELIKGIEVRSATVLSRNEFYILCSLAEVQFNTGSRDESEANLLRVLEASVESDFAFYACYSLHELASQWQSSGRSNLWRLAVQAALSIPRSSAPAIRKQIDLTAAENKIEPLRGQSWPDLINTLIEMRRNLN